MSNQQRELFRHAILECLDAAGTRFGLGVAGLRIHLGAFGFPGSGEADITREVEYLADKSLVAEVTKQVSPENRAWRITATGRDHLATQP